MSDPKPRNYGEVPTTVENRSSAKDALQKSCYFKIDFAISEDATVYEAVQRFAAYNIGALAVTNADEKVIGIVSERDYVSKVRASQIQRELGRAVMARRRRMRCLPTPRGRCVSSRPVDDETMVQVAGRQDDWPIRADPDVIQLLRTCSILNIEGERPRAVQLLLL